jgi:glycerol-3-phosphate acyltransferase PlsY
MTMLISIVLVLFAYMLGSIPFGYIFTRRFTGKNILESGSGNIGSTNVGRIAGRKISALTQICDIMKGFLPVSLLWFLQEKNLFQFEGYCIFLVALAAILGHDFSVFLRLKGGKGVNTTLGASLLIAPCSVFISVLIYLILKWKFKIVSLGSIGLAISLPISDLIIHKISFTFYYLLLSSALIIILHFPNIKRLLKGNENRTQ